ncbi:MFS glucose transporter [Lachnellula hyalina]|uniref:MFS glucose transporter n=1 Tax=Lachnellula hyalina TaxID=1316788 RepID=A0A8H8R0U1_9HELO|nr:MFS glucose transporter [Lachnellula hyalina]TVY25685.1 MFS glucose transporter [Lachnellula hyalina]
MGRIFNVSLAVFAATGSFLFGYDGGVMTDVIGSNNFLKYFNTTDTSSIIGAINSTFNGGAVFGSLMGGLTMDRFGRRMTIQIGALICLVGAILQAAAKNLGMILVGRIFAGWAVGLLSMAVPVYQSECAHPKIRGLIVGMSQQMIGIGFIVSTWVGFGSAHAGDQSQFQWRFPLAFQAVPCVILAIGMIFFPESPRHLMATDREEEAMRVLKKLHYNGSNADWVETEFNEIKQTLAAEKSVTVPGWKIMFTVPQWRTRLFHGVAVQVFTQLSGINVIGYYQVIMYKALGFTGGKAILISGIYNCVGPVSNFIFIVFILDRVGRRKPLLFGTIGITLALICEGAINSQNTEGTRHSLSIAGVFFIFLVSIIFSFSFGPISWVYMGEVMPMQIRARGNAFATGIGNWLVATFFAQISPIALGNIGWKFYFVFVAFNIAITFPVVFFFFKETNQVSLEDIDLLFGERALGALPADLHKEGALEVLPKTVDAEVPDIKV